jgi:steroid delta-isomerase-like uncharacterized protein
MGTAREVFEKGHKAFNDRDIDTLIGLYAEDAEFRGSGGMELKGREPIRQFTLSWLQGFPDCKLETTNIVATETHVVEEGVFKGTHTGTFVTPMGDIPATGRSVRGPYVDVFEIRDGRIVSDHLTFDRMELMEQLGLVPQPTAAG